MDLDFSLSLDERLPDRVLVSVLLRPRPEEDADVQGVSVELVGESGERLSHQLRLPIAGVLTQPMRTTVELRALRPLPQGARVLGTAWTAEEQWEATCPADPGTQLRAHVRGWGTIRPKSDEFFEALSGPERTVLGGAVPWLAPCRQAPPAVVETPDVHPDEVRKFCEDLGLQGEDSEWLEDLLNEPD